MGDTLVSYSGTESTVTIPRRRPGHRGERLQEQRLRSQRHLPRLPEEIGYRAFYDCDNLQSVSLPETMKVINEARSTTART